MAGNVERLQHAGYTIKTPLPQEYEEAFEALSDGEVEALISVKERFDEAQVSLGGEPPYTEYVAPF